MPITSKLEAEARTTIPVEVRSALQLREGDDIAYLIDGRHVRLAKLHAGTLEDPFATFDEWSGDADRKAYESL